MAGEETRGIVGHVVGGYCVKSIERRIWILRIGRGESEWWMIEGGMKIMFFWVMLSIAGVVDVVEVGWLMSSFD